MNRPGSWPKDSQQSQPRRSATFRNGNIAAAAIIRPKRRSAYWRRLSAPMRLKAEPFSTRFQDQAAHPLQPPLKEGAISESSLRNAIADWRLPDCKASSVSVSKRRPNGQGPVHGQSRARSCRVHRHYGLGALALIVPRLFVTPHR